MRQPPKTLFFAGYAGILPAFFNKMRARRPRTQGFSEVAMSIQAILQYRAELEKLVKHGGTAKPYQLRITNAGIIILDSQTELNGIPAEAWDYKLGNRSALEWILDQYQEKKPKDPTIAENFNIYRFSDYKVKVMDLLTRVCAVSVQTMQIIKQEVVIAKMPFS